MKVVNTPLEGCLIIEPDVFGDDRGFFLKHINLTDIKKMLVLILISFKIIIQGLHLVFCADFIFKN